MCQKHFTNKFLNTDNNLVSSIRKTNPLRTEKKNMLTVNSTDILQLISLLRNQENFTAQSLFNNMNTQCSKKGVNVANLSHTVESWVGVKFDGIFRMEAKIERSLIRKALLKLFHLSSQMSLTNVMVSRKCK